MTPPDPGHTIRGMSPLTRDAARGSAIILLALAGHAVGFALALVAIGALTGADGVTRALAIPSIADVAGGLLAGAAARIVPASGRRAVPVTATCLLACVLRVGTVGLAADAFAWIGAHPRPWWSHFAVALAPHAVPWTLATLALCATTSALPATRART